MCYILEKKIALELYIVFGWPAEETLWWIDVSQRKHNEVVFTIEEVYLVNKPLYQ